MAATDYEPQRTSGDFAYKVHSVLEGRGDNETEFEEIENLTEKVAEFYNDFSEYGGEIGMGTRFIELNFEVYLEEDEEYGSEQRWEAVDRLTDGPSEISVSNIEEQNIKLF